jgi:hypothetical protein
MHRFYPSSLLQLLILSATLGSVTARADYVQTNLVSDIPGFASIMDQVHFGYRIRELMYRPSTPLLVEP